MEATLAANAQESRPRPKKDAAARVHQLLAQKKAAQKLTETALIVAAQHYGLSPDEVLEFYRQNIERAHYFTAEGCALLFKQRRKESHG